MSLSQPIVDTTTTVSLQRSMHEHWKMFLAEGGLLCLLGAAAIIVPPFAGLIATIFLGWLFFVAGVVGLLFTLRTRQAPGYGWSLLSAIAAIIAGGVLIWNPLQGLFTLTYVLIAFFILDGLFMIMLALSHRKELSGRWEWLLLNGIIDLLLAGIIVSGMPGTLAWALGLLVGIDLLFGGSSLIAVALQARKTAA